MSFIADSISLSSLFHGPVEIINSGFCAPVENMRIDTERAYQCAKEQALPMFRLYAWKPWAVSLGANQREEDIDQRQCNERGFEIVHRPTGGRAVLHAHEITYSVVLTLANGQTIQDIYRDIHLRLLYGLSLLGAENIAFQRSQSDFRTIYRSTESLLCFASAARYEIEWKGKKVVGSAQRRFGNTLLQHGSILLGAGHEQLADAVRTDNEQQREKMRVLLCAHTATVEEICQRTIHYDEAATALIRGFMEFLPEPVSYEQ